MHQLNRARSARKIFLRVFLAFVGGVESRLWGGGGSKGTLWEEGGGGGVSSLFVGAVGAFWGGSFRDPATALSFLWCFLPAARSERQRSGFHCNAGLHLMASVTHHTRSVKKKACDTHIEAPPKRFLAERQHA